MDSEQPLDVAPEEPAARSPPASRLAAPCPRGLAALSRSGGGVGTFFTVDLGPSLVARAEREGSKYLERPMHIGRLSAKITPGVFVVEDLVIEGLQPADRPFLKAKKIEVSVPWWTIFSRRLIIDSVAMTDWEMVVEAWPRSAAFPNGRHTSPGS